MVQEETDRVRRRLAVFLLSCVLLSPSCKNDLDNITSVDVAESGPDRTTTHAEYIYSDSGRVTNRLWAGRVLDYLTKGKEHTEIEDSLHVTFYDSTGAPGSELSAQRGRIWNQQHRMQVDGKVVFINAKGERLETEQLIWSQDSGRVYTDKPVRIARERDILYGQGLDAEQDFSRYTIRQVTGTLYVNESDTLAH